MPSTITSPPLDPSDAATDVRSPVSTPRSANPTVVSAPRSANPTVWKIFGSTFITIFLAELGDKTQVSTLLMSAQFHKPWVVFAGAGMALVTTSLLGVWVGCWLAERVSPKLLDRSASVTLAILSLWLVWDIGQL